MPHAFKTNSEKAAKALVRKSLTLLGSVALIILSGCGQSSKIGDGPLPPPQMKLISESQYRNTVSDLLGQDIKVVGRFEHAPEVEGMAALGATEVSISSRGYERYYAMATQIAAQATSDGNWDRIIDCSKDSSAQFDVECAKNAINNLGEKLLRRPLSNEEVQGWLSLAEASTQELGSFQDAMTLVVEGFLASPEFLFLIDHTETDEKGNVRLTAHAKAHRLSYFLWNSVPDEELLAQAQSGALHDKKVLQEQVARMISSEKLEVGVEAFFEDFLDLDAFDTLNKDKLIYPAFNKQVAVDAKKQVQKFLTYHLLEKEAPYSSIFTAKETFMTRPLGMLYRVPVSSREQWEKYTFSESDPRAGLLSHVGFTALHSHPGRSSATLRGIAVRELLLCQPVAPAPAAVNFTVVQETDNPDFKTARARLTQHRTDDACRSCHEFIDPIGLALENFDGAGQFRIAENGEAIDASGVLDANEFSNLEEMQFSLAEHPATAPCLVEKMQKFAIGRKPGQIDRAWRIRLEKKFSKKKQNLRALLSDVALSEEFFAVAAPKTSTETQTVNLEEQGNKS